MILSPSAAGTMNLPPLKEVPTGAVVIDATWQRLQPMALNRLLPATTSDELITAESTGGTLVDRMKRTKAPTSTPKGSAPVATSSGSATVSNAATERPSWVFSVGCSGLVM